jgi:hypothetical protein
MKLTIHRHIKLRIRGGLPPRPHKLSQEQLIYNLKGEDKVAPVLNEVVIQLHAPATLPPRYPLEKSVGGPQSQSGRGSEEKKNTLYIKIALFFVYLQHM